MNLNKYAIIEYLKDISKEPYFKLIILTHNYDFYRTVGSRLDVGRPEKLHAEKSANGIKLKEEKYQNNPFLHWKGKLADNKAMFIASIPFVRNLAEYSGDDDNFNTLTSVVHMKADTESITVADIEGIFKSILKDRSELAIPDSNKKIIDLIFDTATVLLLDENEERMELESKIVLAIAIRLKAEEFVIAKINDSSFVAEITKNQTFELVRKYKEVFPADVVKIKILDQVNLMTPENIHLNSFMYEPILDMSNHRLKELYQNVCSVLINNDIAN